VISITGRDPFTQRREAFSMAITFPLELPAFPDAQRDMETMQ